MPPSDDDGDVGRRGLNGFLVACRVSVEEDAAFLGLGVLLPSDVRRALTLIGVVSLEPDKRVLPVILGGTAVALSPVGKLKPLGGLVVVGLRMPISRIPRSSSWNRVFTR